MQELTHHCMKLEAQGLRVAAIVAGCAGTIANVVAVCAVGGMSEQKALQAIDDLRAPMVEAFKKRLIELRAAKCADQLANPQGSA